MTALAQKLMTAEEFLAWAEARPEKHWELFHGLPQMQQPQGWGHQQTIGALYLLLHTAIQDAKLGLFVASQGLIVKAGQRTAFEPDIVVFAGPMDDHDIIVPKPVIVIEVLSDSTARKDRTVKLDGYFAVPSIRHYLIVDWEERKITHYRRENSGMAKPVILREGALTLDPRGLILDISKVFEDR